MWMATEYTWRCIFAIRRKKKTLPLRRLHSRVLSLHEILANLIFAIVKFFFLLVVNRPSSMSSGPSFRGGWLWYIQKFVDQNRRQSGKSGHDSRVLDIPRWWCQRIFWWQRLGIQSNLVLMFLNWHWQRVENMPLTAGRKKTFHVSHGNGQI